MFNEKWLHIVFKITEDHSLEAHFMVKMKEIWLRNPPSQDSTYKTLILCNHF